MPYFLPYQLRWLEDQSPLKIIEKSRQIGMTFVDAYDSVLKAARSGRTSRLLPHPTGITPPPLDVWVSSRDEATARLYLQTCKAWAELLQISAEDMGEQIIDSKEKLAAWVLRFATGRSIHALSSTPDAIVGRHGHIKLDEYAVHKNQRALYRYAKPGTTWAGQLSIISTHRGSETVFNEFITSIKEKGNPMGWSHHRVTIHDAVQQGLLEKINAKSGRHETPEQFLARLRKQCIDEEQWLQEYCCVPLDDSSAFITYEMINACESPNCLKPLSWLLQSFSSSSSHSADSTVQRFNDLTSFYVGIDVASKNDLCVIDVGEKIGDVVWDRLRVELRGKKFSEIEHELWPILELPNVKRACIDATGPGSHIAERTRDRFGWKVEPIVFTPAVKQDLAFTLRAAFEDRLLRIDPDPKLKADLRGIKKEVSLSGNIRFVGEAEDSHCDRFWAKALRQHAAKHKVTFGAFVV
jgi:phage FluMu gp28-like protein